MTFWWKLSGKTCEIVRIFSIKGFRLFNSSINIVLTFKFGFACIEIEPALILHHTVMYWTAIGIVDYSYWYRVCFTHEKMSRVRLKTCKYMKSISK